MKYCVYFGDFIFTVIAKCKHNVRYRNGDIYGIYVTVFIVKCILVVSIFETFFLGTSIFDPLFISI